MARDRGVSGSYVDRAFRVRPGQEMGPRAHTRLARAEKRGKRQALRDDLENLRRVTQEGRERTALILRFRRAQLARP